VAFETLTASGSEISQICSEKAKTSIDYLNSESAKESKTVGNGLLEMSSTSSHFTDVKRVLGHLIGYRNELEQYEPQEHKN